MGAKLQHQTRATGGKKRNSDSQHAPKPQKQRHAQAVVETHVAEGGEKVAKKKKNKAKKMPLATSPHPEPAAPPSANDDALPNRAPPARVGVLAKMQQRLAGSRFRWLNEQLYTASGEDAWQLMQGQQELFTQYHEVCTISGTLEKVDQCAFFHHHHCQHTSSLLSPKGFREQTRGWPQQPVEVAIAWLLGKPATWSVADFGCGDATLAVRVPQQVHSFDLVAANERVVACNMAHVPIGV